MNCNPTETEIGYLKKRTSNEFWLGKFGPYDMVRFLGFQKMVDEVLIMNKRYEMFRENHL